MEGGWWRHPGSCLAAKCLHTIQNFSNHLPYEDISRVKGMCHIRRQQTVYVESAAQQQKHVVVISLG